MTTTVKHAAKDPARDPAVDRFSGLDVRYMHDARDEFGVDKYTAAQEVLDYADRVEGKTRMGGATEDALDALRALLKGKGGELHLLDLKKTPTLLWKKHLRTASHLR